MAKGLGRIAAMIGVAAAFFLLSEAAAPAAGSSTGSASSRGAGAPIALPPPPAALPPIASAHDGGIEYLAVPGGTVAHVSFGAESSGHSPGSAPLSGNALPYQLGVKTWVEGWTFFRNGRCAEAEAGFWVENTAPQYGHANSTMITYPFAGCNAPMAVLYYTMTSVIPPGGQDYFDDQWWIDGNTGGSSQHPYD